MTAIWPTASAGPAAFSSQEAWSTAQRPAEVRTRSRGTGDLAGSASLRRLQERGGGADLGRHRAR